MSASLAAAEPHDAAPADEPPGCCGWFDSSHALASGLAVIEHRGFDALPAGLPLAWQMAAWMNASVGAGPLTSRPSAARGPRTS